MKECLRILLYALLFQGFTHLHAQSNAAPSEHLTFSFPSDAVLKMQKIKIVQSAYTSYFEIHSFTDGYAGLQQTPDSSKGSSHTLISSLWDPSTADSIYSAVAYKASNTYTGRFGGEGDGYQSINPYNWTLNTWYNMVIRSWKSGGQLYIATFINNLSTNVWFHTATLSIPAPSGYLGSGNDAFLENWDGSNASWDGRFIRKAFLKDCWNLNTSGAWQKHTSRYFSANSGDSARNGAYDLAFNAGYDSTEDAYFMAHGGTTTPSADFGTGRTLTLPAQTNQGTAPTITSGAVLSVTPTYNLGTTTVNWVIDSTKSPQLSASVEILNAAGTVLSTIQDTIPQKRSATITYTLPVGNYTARVTIRDIFNALSSSTTATFTVSNDTTWYKIKNVSSGKYLGVKDSSTSNAANIVQYTGSASKGLQWYLSPQSNGAYVLINRKTAKAIDVSGSIQTLGVDLIQYVITNNTNQQWNLVSAGSGNYLLQSNLSNHYVMDDSASSTTNGTNIILYSASGSTGSSNQQWTLETVTTTNAVTEKVTTTQPAAEDSTNGSISLAPNPAHTTLKLNLGSAPLLKNTAVYFYDVAGKTVKTIHPASNQSEVSIADLPAGLYFISYNKKTMRFVKQ